MKKLKFNCGNCEKQRLMIVNEEDEFYIYGICEVCKKRVVLNRRILKI